MFCEVFFDAGINYWHSIASILIQSAVTFIVMFFLLFSPGYTFIFICISVVLGRRFLLGTDMTYSEHFKRSRESLLDMCGSFKGKVLV